MLKCLPNLERSPRHCRLLAELTTDDQVRTVRQLCSNPTSMLRLAGTPPNGTDAHGDFAVARFVPLSGLRLSCAPPAAPYKTVASAWPLLGRRQLLDVCCVAACCEISCSSERT